MNVAGIASAAFALLVWGVTFANTRALLMDFSALEIMVVRFALAWVVLWGMKGIAHFTEMRPRWGWGAAHFTEMRPRGGWGAAHFTEMRPRGWWGEWLFVGMGLTGVFVYQFLENCAIYYTNAGNVAILVSFGPVVTALMAKVFCRRVQPTLCKVWVGSAVAICGVALVSLNNAVVFEIRPLGDLMALGAVSGERYCKQHSAIHATKQASEKCRSFTADGKPCSSKPAAGKRYCERHMKQPRHIS